MYKVHVSYPAQAAPFECVQVGCCNSRMILLHDTNLFLLKLCHVIMHHAKIPIEFYFHLEDDVAFEYNNSRFSGV